MNYFESLFKYENSINYYFRSNAHDLNNAKEASDKIHKEIPEIKQTVENELRNILNIRTKIT